MYILLFTITLKTFIPENGWQHYEPKSVDFRCIILYSLKHSCLKHVLTDISIDLLNYYFFYYKFSVEKK